MSETPRRSSKRRRNVVAVGHAVEAVTVEKVFENESGRTVLYVSGAVGQRPFKGILVEPTRTSEGDGTTIEQLVSHHLLHTDPPGHEVYPTKKTVVTMESSKRPRAIPRAQLGGSTAPSYLADSNGEAAAAAQPGAGEANAAAEAASEDASEAGGPPGPSVIVVGAGLSGLSCALSLAKSIRAQVTVIEARDRVGGRCWSHGMLAPQRVDLGGAYSHARNGTASGSTNAEVRAGTVDLGAGWIHGIRGNPLARLCSTYGLDLAFTGSGQVIPMYDACTGRMAPPEVDSKVERVFNEGLTAASAVGEVDLLAEEMVAKQAPWLVAAAPGPEPVSPAPEGRTRSRTKKPEGARPHKQRFPGFGMFLPLMEVYLGSVAAWNSVPKETVQEVAVVLESLVFAAECIGTDSMIQQTPLGDYLSVHFEMCIPHATPQEQRLFWWHRSNLEYANATDLGSLSAAYWNFDDEHSFSGAHALLRQGYGSLASRLADDAKRAGVQFRMGHEVNLIDSARGLVAGNKRDGRGASSAFRETADFVVVTLPLGVLKAETVRFEPALPVAKARAIEQLGFGNLNKVALSFPYCFWDPHFPVLAHVSPFPGEFFLAVNMKPVVEANVLVLLASGAFCNALENMTDAEAVQRAMASLQRMFPRVAVPLPLDSIVTRWRSDPHARGSYSFIQRGAAPAAIGDLAAPLPGGKVFFAGEATSSMHIATAHGAYLSGLRASKEIALSFRGASSSNEPQLSQSSTSKSSATPSVTVGPKRRTSHVGPKSARAAGNVGPRRGGRVTRPSTKQKEADAGAGAASSKSSAAASARPTRASTRASSRTRKPIS